MAFKSDLDEALAQALKKMPSNPGAAKALLMDWVARDLNVRDEALMTAIGGIVDGTIREGRHLDDPEALVAEIIRRAKRQHLRLVK